MEQLKQAVDSAQASYDSLVAEHDKLESAINGDGTVTAPCDGIVSAVSYAAGDSFEADQTLVTIAKQDTVYMALSIAEEDVTGIAVGQEAEISLSAYEGQTFPAVVDSLSVEPARSGSASVSYTVSVRMTDPNTLQIFSGMSGEATIIQKQKKDVLYLPNRTITNENGVSTVLLKGADGTGVKTVVTTGFSDGSNVEITSGLKEGDVVLVESAVSAK